MCTPFAYSKSSAEVVVDMAVLGLRAGLPAADADDAHGGTAHPPVDDVQVVNVLLDDVIAGEPGVVQPVAQLVLHVAPVRLPGLVPEPALVPVRACRDDVADRAVLHALHGFQVRGMVAALRAGDDPEAFLLRELRGGDHGLVARGIDAHRLLGEHVLARLDGGLEVHRPEARRGCEDHVVRVAGNHLLEGVPARELAILGDRGAVAELLQVLQAVGEAIREEVACGHEADAHGRVQRVLDRAGAATAAADDADADLVAAGRPCARDVRGRGERAAHHDRGARLQEVAP